ncbi:MAG: NADH:ubiquinone reductase (Na(+)-transporting) subunit B [Bacteroidaceae bacterium]|nr:NADH:ubiquinone reductase (Na(+)-transporting) subunit B [Bacteroidaceae bacterium]
MKFLVDLRNNLKPNFEKGGKFHYLRSVFDGFDSFLFVPNKTAKSGAHIHDAVDSKRIISFVVIALLPALLFGMYNIGYQNAVSAGQLANTSGMEMFIYGALQVLPKILVSYIVGLSIEFAWAQWKGEEIHEGFLASGILIPMIIPIGCPLWMLAIATAFAVVIGKEIFGGTGMNIFNPALVARAFLFFSYPSMMSGDKVWVANDTVFGLGYQLPDTFTAATPLAQVAAGTYQAACPCEAIVGLIPGSIGETSVIAIALGGLFLLWTGVASWRTMISVFVGGAVAGLIFKALDMTPIEWYEHLVLGGFCFGAVFMATDPVTSCRTNTGKYIFGVFVGLVAVTVRVMNPGYPEGMMLAILLMNMWAPLIDYCVVNSNISKRAKRATIK